jgi:hypothetical protein
MFGRNNHNELVQYVEDGNYSLTPTGADIFHPDIHAPGTMFPTDGLRERARICATNDALYRNDIIRVFNNVLQIFPEREPITGQQVRQISSEIPLFSKVEDTYKALILAKPPIIKADKKYSDFIGTLDVRALVEKIIRSVLRYGTTGVNVSVIDGKIRASVVPPRCLTIYLSDEQLGDVSAYDVSNIVDLPKGRQVVQFFTYFTDGSAISSTFEYSGSYIGKEIDSVELEPFNTCPIVMVTGDEYADDFYRRMYSSGCGVIRTYQNFMRLVERLREIIREIPKSALTVSKDGTGTVIARMDGAIGIDDTDPNPTRSEYKVPTVPIEQARMAYKTAVEEFANDCMLGLAWFDLEKAGSSLSAKAIEALMTQARIYASDLQTMVGVGLEKIIKTAIKNSTGEDADISIRWFDVFNFDTESFTKTVQSRIGTTLTPEQAVSILDYVDEDEAAERVSGITSQVVNDGTIGGGSDEDDGLE